MKKKLLLIISLFTLHAFSQSGEIDTSFGINGKVTTGLGTNSNWANGIAFQPDGKFIVGGTYVSSHGENDFALARYNSNGTLDETFGVGGKAITEFLTNGYNYSYINSVHVLPDGKIVVFGTTGAQPFVPKSAIVKYNSNGTIDTGFGTNGKVISNLFPTGTKGYRLAVQPDGKLIITSVKLYDGNPDYYIGVERYVENGMLDATFGTNGQAVLSFGAGRSIPSSVALQADGKIVVSCTYDQSTIITMGVVRFNANGTLDTGFDGDGKVLTPFGAGSSGEGMQVFINAEGKIIMGAAVYLSDIIHFAVVQYNTNGSLDTGFDGDGKALTALGNWQDYSTINSIARQPDGKFLLACKTGDYNLVATDFVVKKFNSDCTPDTGFGTGGVVSTTFGTALNEVNNVAVTTSGNIFAVGSSRYGAFNNLSDFAIAKYNSSGSLDPALDGDGKLTTTFEKANDRIKITLVLPDDKLIAVGNSAYRQANNAYITDIALSKYNSDGSLDTTFGTSGRVLSNFDNHRNSVVSAALQADGKIVVINSYWISSNTYELIRYNANGSLDTQFGTNGKVGIAAPGTLLCEPDGKIIIAGNSVNGIIINKYNNNGTPDNSFDSDGSAVVSLWEYSGQGVSAVLQPDGKVIVSDGVFPSFGTMRINTDGSPDTTFGDNGKVLTTIHDIAIPLGTFLGPGGKIIVAGISLTQGTYFSSVRYLANGTIDTDYGMDGISSAELFTDYRQVTSIALQPDGKLLAALSKSNNETGTFDFKIKRFNTDGTYDDSFGGQEGITTSFYSGYDEAFSVVLQSNNKIVVAGATHNGINEDFALARYTNTILAVNQHTTDVSTITVYPNPVKDVLHISTTAGMDVIDYTIYNMMGQVILSNPGTALDINTAGLSKGIYNIVIKTGKGTVTKKFVRE